MKRLLVAGLAASLWSCGAAAQSADVPRGFVQIFRLGATASDGQMRSVETIGDTFDWGKPEDYPAGAAARRAEGWVRIGFTVGANDRVSDCAIVRSGAMMADERGSYQFVNAPADADMKASACAILKRRGAFRHALRANGSGIPATVTFQVNFMMRNPGRVLYMAPPPLPAAPYREARRPVPLDSGNLILHDSPADFPTGRVSVYATVSKEGMVTRCVIGETSRTDKGDVAACKQVSAMRFEPARDMAGQPIDGSEAKLWLSNAP